MTLSFSDYADTSSDALSVIEEVLETAGWPYERDDDDAIQCVAETRWGDMGALFAWRPEPHAVHFSLTLDVKPKAIKKAAINELIIMANERLWLGHFDYWAEEGVIIYRAAFPLIERDEPSISEVRAAVAASVSAVDRYVPAFNFVIWAGKTPKEAIEAAMFETQGEA